jgi:hypothetical protein
MACLKVLRGDKYLILSEGADGLVRGTIKGDVIKEVLWNCGPNPIADDIFSSQGLMVGNLVKKVTAAVGIKQCFRCRGRQRRWNKKGLAVQQKIKSLIGL